MFNLHSPSGPRVGRPTPNRTRRPAGKARWVTCMILEPLGAGGTGEVYLGEGTRLGRKVARCWRPQKRTSP